MNEQLITGRQSKAVTTANGSMLLGRPVGRCSYGRSYPGRSGGSYGSTRRCLGSSRVVTGAATDAAARYKFGVLGAHDLKEAMGKREYRFLKHVSCTRYAIPSRRDACFKRWRFLDGASVPIAITRELRRNRRQPRSCADRLVECYQSPLCSVTWTPLIWLWSTCSGGETRAWACRKPRFSPVGPTVTLGVSALHTVNDWKRQQSKTPQPTDRGKLHTLATSCMSVFDILTRSLHSGYMS